MAGRRLVTPALETAARQSRRSVTRASSGSRVHCGARHPGRTGPAGGATCGAGTPQHKRAASTWASFEDATQADTGMVSRVPAERACRQRRPD